MLTRIAAALILVFALSACSGGDDSPTDSKTSTTNSPSTGSTATEAPSKPDCASIWKDGAALPKDYTGCVKSGAQSSVKCKDGRALIVFDETYFALTGGKITKSPVTPLEDTEAYGAAYSDCTGE